MPWQADVSPGERLLCDAADSGAEVDLSGGSGPDLVVRAEVVAALVLGETKSGAAFVSGVRLVGATISGELDLQHGELRRPLMLRACRFASQSGLTMLGRHLLICGSLISRGCMRTGRVFSGNLDLRDAVAGAEKEAGAVNRKAQTGSAVRAVGALIDGDL